MRDARWTESRYLRDEQYRDSANLGARMALHERFSTAAERWPHWVFRQLDLTTGLRVLELGCGPGRLWTENADRLPAGLALTLADQSCGMVREAVGALRAVVPALTPRAIQLDAQALPFRDACFDLVIANHMLYHVADLPGTLAEIRRVLIPGGRFYAATNGRGHMGELDRLLGGDGRSTARSFNLENGATLLGHFFPTVSLLPYADGLRVTEAAPLLAYARSMHGVGERDFAALEREVVRRLTADGVVLIAKESGLFRAE